MKLRMFCKTVALKGEISLSVQQDLSFLKDKIGALLYSRLNTYLSIIFTKDQSKYAGYISKLREYSQGLRQLESITLFDIRQQLIDNPDNEAEFFSVRSSIGLQFLYSVLKINGIGIDYETYLLLVEKACFRQIAVFQDKQIELISLRDNVSAEVEKQCNDLLPGALDLFKLVGLGKTEYYRYDANGLTYYPVVVSLLSFLEPIQNAGGTISFGVHTHPLRANERVFEPDSNIPEYRKQGEYFSQKDNTVNQQISRRAALHSDRGFSFVDPVEELNGGLLEDCRFCDSSNVRGDIISKMVNFAMRRALASDILTALARLGFRGKNTFFSLVKMFIELYENPKKKDEILQRLQALSDANPKMKMLINFINEGCWQNKLNIRSEYRQVTSARKGYLPVFVSEKSLENEEKNIKKMSADEAHEYLVLKRSSYLRDLISLRYGLVDIFTCSDSWREIEAEGKSYVSEKVVKTLKELRSNMNNATTLEGVRELARAIRKAVQNFYQNNELYKDQR